MGSVLSFATDLLGDLDICLYSLVSLGFTYLANLEYLQAKAILYLLG